MIQELFGSGVSISEIARRTGHDRKTVRSVVNGPLMPAVKARPPRARKIDPFVTYLEKRIEQGVLNAEKLYQEIRARGYTGKARTVRQFVQPRRAPRQPVATVRFETEPGQQAQVDWASFGMIDHFGRQRRLYAFVMTLGRSRAMYIEFTVSMDATWQRRCHLHAFHYFGGVPREVLHNYLKTAVCAS
jgi:transposase